MATKLTETLLKAVREQAYQYVNKPIEPKALLQTVRDVLKAQAPPPIEVVDLKVR